jgi:hypothetical protein
VHSRIGAPERVGKRRCPPRTDPRDPTPFGGGGLEDAGDAAELSQECLCGGRRNAAYGREHRLRHRFWARLGPLRVCRSCAWFRTRSADGQTAKPVCRVVSVPRLNQSHAHVEDGDANATDGMSRQRPVVDRAALDEQVRLSGRGAQGAELAPEPPLLKRRVKVKHLLALDDRAVIEEVVPCCKPTHFESHPSATQALVHRGRPLEHIDGDPRRSSHRHEAWRVQPGRALGRFSGAETA